MANQKDAEYEFSDESIEYGRRLVLDWNDFATAATSLPEYEEKSRTVITNMLGYLPPFPTVYMPYEPFIRSRISTYEKEGINALQFMEEIEFCVKKIRNDDLKKHGFVGKGPFSEQDYAYYETFRASNKETARRRLSRLLGYEPLVEHSLSAEIHLRQLIMEDYFHEELPLDKVDHRSFTIYHHTKHRIEHGLEAADASPLVRISG